MASHPRAIKLEGVDVYPAKVEGLPDVFENPKFVLAKSRWVADQEASNCPLCNNKFNQIRRKHHCRQCGKVMCSKCCKEKIPLPQLGIDEPERVCEACRPVTEFVTKSRSHLVEFQTEAAVGLVNMCMEPHGLCKLVELGGIQTLVGLARQDNEPLLTRVVNGLHLLSMLHPLHRLLVDAGAIKAVCSVLMRKPDPPEQAITDGISTLMIFCKSPEIRTTVGNSRKLFNMHLYRESDNNVNVSYSAEIRTTALEHGTLTTILKLCGSNNSEAVSLLAVSTLSLIVENPATHVKVVESEHNPLAKILSLTYSSDEQMQEVSLKTLAHISLGSDWHRHRIVQEDFTSGRSLQKAISSKPKNEQILCNAACLISNLATSEEDQGGLQELMECLCDQLRSDTKNTNLLIHVSRGIANFAKYQQNADRLMKYLPLVVFKCLKSQNHQLKMHGMRAVLHLLFYRSSSTVQELLSSGAGDLLEGMAKLPGLTQAIQTCLLHQAPDKAKPL